MPSKLRLVAVIATLALLPGCGGGHGQASLGVRKLSLDLVFKDQSKAPKPVAAAPQEQAPAITQLIAGSRPLATTDQVIANITAPTPQAAIRPLAPACPAAPAGALPQDPVAGQPGQPPAAGVYSQHDTGHFSLDAGPLKLSGQFPPFGTMEIGNVTDVTAADAIGGLVRTISYDVIVRTILSTSTTRYQSVTRESAHNFSLAPSAITSELDLVSAETKSSNGSTSFKPTPPITIMQYGGEGTLWKSTGVDQATNTVMTVQGQIAKREPVDVCGKLIDTYRVESIEQVVNLATGYTSQTADGDPNVYSVATQFGGLMVQQHTNTTTSFTANGTPGTLIVDSTSTVDSITPKAPGAG